LPFALNGASGVTATPPYSGRLGCSACQESSIAANRLSTCWRSADRYRQCQARGARNGSANVPCCSHFGASGFDALTVAERGKNVQEGRRRFPLPVELGRREFRDLAEFVPGQREAHLGGSNPALVPPIAFHTDPRCFCFPANEDRLVVPDALATTIKSVKLGCPGGARSPGVDGIRPAGQVLVP